VSFNGQSVGRTSSAYIDPDRRKMRGWDRVKASASGARFGRNSTMNERTQSSRTVRLGRVTPQAPTHRTIYCNDREANQLVRFRVCQPLFFFFFFFFFVYNKYTHVFVICMCVCVCVFPSSFFFFFSWFSLCLVEEKRWEMKEDRNLRLLILHKYVQTSNWILTKSI
jgi:hypothetical protein